MWFANPPADGVLTNYPQSCVSEPAPTRALLIPLRVRGGRGGFMTPLRVVGFMIIGTRTFDVPGLIMPEKRSFTWTAGIAIAWDQAVSAADGISAACVS
jgi:hypothetical protein